MRSLAKAGSSSSVSAACRPIATFFACAKIAFIIVLGTMLAGFHALQAANVTESSVKAAFLYKFLSYVEWPPDRFSSPLEPIVIGILGNPEITAALREIAVDSSVGGRELRVRSMRRGASLDGLHVLFIGRNTQTALERLVSAAQERSIMTVTETEGAQPLAVIDFLVIDGHVRFSASIPAADRTGIKLSSRLLAVAETVVIERP